MGAAAAAQLQDGGASAAAAAAAAARGACGNPSLLLLFLLKGYILSRTHLALARECHKVGVGPGQFHLKFLRGGGV